MENMAYCEDLVVWGEGYFANGQKVTLSWNLFQNDVWQRLMDQQYNFCITVWQTSGLRRTDLSTQICLPPIKALT